VSRVLNDIGFWRTAGIIAAAVGQTMFVLLYLTFPWWRNFLGRALFGKALAFALLVDLAVVGRMIDWPKEDVYFVVLYWVLAAGIWAQFIAFLRVRLNNRQDVVSGNRGPLS
jgi:hypothetical protein